MALSHPVTLRTLVTGKVALRFCFVLAVAVVFALLGGLLGGMAWNVPGTWTRLFLWACVVAVYGAFWFGLGVAVSARGSGSASNAMTLAGLWLLFVVLIPSLLNAAVTAAHPAPSRVELINAMRDAANDANSEGSRLLARYTWRITRSWPEALPPRLTPPQSQRSRRTGWLPPCSLCLTASTSNWSSSRDL